MLRNRIPLRLLISKHGPTIRSRYAMVDQRDIKDPKYWRARAGEARAQAAQMRDPRAKRALLGIAENYDQLAERTEAMARSTKPPTSP
jgi:hypothetical protein